MEENKMKKALIIFIALSILFLGGCSPIQPLTLPNESYIVVYQYGDQIIADNSHSIPIIYTSYDEAIKHAPCPSYIFKLYSKVESNPVQKIITSIEDGRIK
jgi:hypothetical protein